MTTGTGLDAQIGYGSEITWGTAVTADRFLEFNDETIKLDPKWLEPTGLHVGVKYKRAARVRRSRIGVIGDVTHEVSTLGIGRLIKYALASSVVTPTQIAATTAYKQIHTPGDFRGLGFTTQIGRPEPATGTVRPFTYSGCKATGWEFMLKDSEIPTFKMTIDAQNETTVTALTAASFLSGSSVFDFSQATLKLGGTATTASGETTISGGTTVATIIKDISVQGAAPMATDRYGIGNAGLKAQPLENATPTIKGKLTAEFGKTEFYDVYSALTTTALQLDMTGVNIAAGNNFLFSIIIPALKFKAMAPNVKGPDIVQMSTDYEVYSDEINPVIQIKIVSTETVL